MVKRNLLTLHGLLAITGMILAAASNPPAAMAQSIFGNEQVFENTPSVEELENLLAPQEKIRFKTRGLNFDTAPAAEETTPQNPDLSGAETARQPAPAEYASTATANDPVVISVRIKFPVNSADILPEYQAGLANLAIVLRQQTSIKLEIGGHADATGPDDVNLRLSQQRAQAVLQHLVEIHGLDASRFTARGYGEYQPLQGLHGNDPRNRRVTFLPQ